MDSFVCYEKEVANPPPIMDVVKKAPHHSFDDDGRKERFSARSRQNLLPVLLYLDFCLMAYGMEQRQW